MQLASLAICSGHLVSGFEGGRGSLTDGGRTLQNDVSGALMNSGRRPSCDGVRDAGRGRDRDLCARCRVEGPRCGQVRIGLFEPVPGGKNPRAVTGKSIAFCEPCAVEVYKQIFEVVTRECS